jgi:hypothetical protein
MDGQKDKQNTLDQRLTERCAECRERIEVETPLHHKESTKQKVRLDLPGER